MENEIICLDTSVLIDYFRKKNKENSFFYELTKIHSLFAVSVITEFEIFSGSNDTQDIFWNEFFKMLKIIPFNSEINSISIKISKELRKKGKQIDIPDLFIGCSALSNNMKLATLNKKHFENIENLQLLTNESIRTH